jgi:hypothetical protein
MDGEKEYIILTLGDKSTHELFLPEPNEPTSINLKLS